MNKGFRCILAALALSLLLMGNVFAEEEYSEEGEEIFEIPEYIEWGIGFIGFCAAVAASYYAVKAFGGAVGEAMGLYAVGILLMGLGSITCFMFYIVGFGHLEDLSVFIEDMLRTVALLIFAYAGYKMYKIHRSRAQLS